MSEIKNPEQQMDKPSVEKSPEDLRKAEASRNKAEGDLDSGSSKDAMVRTEKPEQSTSRSDSPAESKEQKKENSLESKNAEGQVFEKSHTEPHKESDRVEQEKSKFSKENFKAENSYDAKATQNTKELAAKATSEMVPMGGDTSAKRNPRESYTAQEVSTLKTERDRVEAPNRETVMQKVIGVDTGNVKKDLSAYLNPTDRDTGKRKDADVYGFVAKAQDATPYTGTPKDCYENLRLDYDKTEYKDPNQSVYVLRFTDGENYKVPYNEKFGGDSKEAQPCTGNGYLGGDKHLIPEYKVDPQNNQGAVITDGTIYRVNPNGSEDPVAKYDEDSKRFVLC